MAKSLQDLVNLRLKEDNLSLRKAADQANVAHTTIDRIRKGEQVDLGTVKKICDWLGTPVSSILDIGNKQSPKAEEVVALFSLNDEFLEVFYEIAEKVKSEEVDTDILNEITAFADFRLQKHLSKKRK
jgi:DNA-binding Xre family transcriptional regulator